MPENHGESELAFRFGFNITEKEFRDSEIKKEIGAVE